MTQPFIRYLAATDERATGRLALEYLKAFLRLRLSVRVGSVTGGLIGAWEHYSQLLATPMDGPFVNVVCCDPNRWIWSQRVPMPTKKADGTLVFDGDVAEGVQELRTDGVRNVLIVNQGATDSTPFGSAERYDAIICPTADLALCWEPLRPPVLHIPVPVVPPHLATLQIVLFGAAPP